MTKDGYRNRRLYSVKWCQFFRRYITDHDGDYYYYMLKEEQRQMAQNRYDYFTARKRKMTILRNVFFTFILSVAVAILMSIQGCALMAATKALTEGDEKIDVKERMEMLTLDYDCQPASFDEDIDGRREKHHLHIECQLIK